MRALGTIEREDSGTSNGPEKRTKKICQIKSHKYSFEYTGKHKG